MGYRVLISIDAECACERFMQQPFQAFIVDVGTAGEEGLHAMNKVLSDAKLFSLECVGILILSETQADWQDRANAIEGATVLLRPVTMKQITTVLRERLPSEDEHPDEV